MSMVSNGQHPFTLAICPGGDGSGRLSPACSKQNHRHQERNINANVKLNKMASKYTHFLSNSLSPKLSSDRSTSVVSSSLAGKLATEGRCHVIIAHYNVGQQLRSGEEDGMKKENISKKRTTTSVEKL